MSAHRSSVLPTLLLSGSPALPDSPEACALLFLECLGHKIFTWESLLTFHIVHRASPVVWPRSFAESYPMLRLAVTMADTFGDQEDCAEVTRTLAYHLFDRSPHPELMKLVQEALPRGITLLSPSPSETPS